MPGGLAGALASVGGSLIGRSASGDDRDAAADAQKQALAKLIGVHVPTVDEMKVALQQEHQVGTLNNQMAGTVSQDPSAMGNISIDPRLKNAQMDSLAQLQALSKGGLNSQDQNQLMQINQGVNRDAMARQQAVLQNMAARGMAGSGAELAAQLQNAQQGAQSAQAQGMNIAAQAQARALQAISQAGSMGMNMQNQSFGEQSQQAQAMDAINRFNAANRQSVTNTNTDRTNQAAQYNLNNAQTIANQNTALANQQEMHNKGLYQNVFQDAQQNAQAAAGQYNTNTGFHQNQADRTQQMWSGIGDSVGQALNSATGVQGGGGSGGGAKGSGGKTALGEDEGYGLGTSLSSGNPASLAASLLA